MKRRDMVKALAAMAATQPLLSGLGWARDGEGVDPLDHVHPELRAAALAALREARSLPPFTLKTLSELRRAMDGFAMQPGGGVPFERRLVPGVAGQPPVTVYIVNGGGRQGRPAILHTHGGGFVMGTARSGVPALQSFARDLDCVIISVEYRLAPETTYRGSMEDNYGALKWLYANAATLGVDRSRIGVMGESAGGGHAALLAMAARDRGEIPIAFQCLIYPMLDDRTGSSRFVPPSIGRLVWTASDNRLGWGAFLGMPPGTTSVPTDAVPARAAHLAGLPPTYIAVGSIDLFVNEDIDFAQRLVDAGVGTELLVSPGAFHGFDLFPEAAGSTILKQFNDARLLALRRGLKIG